MTKRYHGWQLLDPEEQEKASYCIILPKIWKFIPNGNLYGFILKTVNSLSDLMNGVIPVTC